MIVRRTHTWGDAPFSWGATPLARTESLDGTSSFAAYADGAVVEWDRMGDVARLIARTEPALAAAFDPGVEHVLLLRAFQHRVGHQITRIALSTGARDVHTRRMSGGERLLVAPDGQTYAAVARHPGGFQTVHRMADGALLDEVGGHREQCLALGTERRRVTLAEILHPEERRLRRSHDESTVGPCAPSMDARRESR